MTPYVRALYVIFLLVQREPRAFAMPFYDGSDVGDLPEAILGICVPFMHALTSVRQARGKRDEVPMSAYINLHTAVQSAIGWGYYLATRAAKMLERSGPSDEYQHLSAKRWAYCHAMDVIGVTGKSVRVFNQTTSGPTRNAWHAASPASWWARS